MLAGGEIPLLPDPVGAHINHTMEGAEGLIRALGWTGGQAAFLIPWLRACASLLQAVSGFPVIYIYICIYIYIYIYMYIYM